MEPSRQPDRRLALDCGVASASFVDDEVLYDSRRRRLFVLNPSAASVIRGLRGDVSDEEIVDAFVRHAGVPLTTARKDVQAFIHSLDEAGLLLSGERQEPLTTKKRRPPDAPVVLEMTCRLGERHIRVVCHHEDIARAFCHLAAPCAIANDAPVQTCLTLFQDEDTFILLENGRVIDRVSDARSARWALVRELVGEGRGRPWLALLHASAVMTPKGCLLLCGESGAGKSTLLAGLVHAGFPFVADDIVLLEQGTGLIWPTPLAISVKERSWPVVGELFSKLAEAPVVRFGGRTMRFLHPGPSAIAGDAGYPIEAVLFVRYQENATTTLKQLDARESLIFLGRGGSILPDTDAGLGEFLHRWRTIPAFRMTYGQLDDAARQLRGFRFGGNGPVVGSAAI